MRFHCNMNNIKIFRKSKAQTNEAKKRIRSKKSKKRGEHLRTKYMVLKKPTNSRESPRGLVIAVNTAKSRDK